MPHDIPPGWFRVTGTIQSGDRIKTASGWIGAEYLGKSNISDMGKSAVGHPTALYECVIRKKET